MPTVASWGSFVFSVDDKKILTYHSLTRKASYKTEPSEDGKNKPHTINKSPDLGTMGFTVPLLSSLGVNPQTESDKWFAACEAGTPYPFIIGAKPVGKGKWQLKDVTLNNPVYGPNSVLLEATLSINFIEFIAAGKAATSSSSSSKPRNPDKKPSTTVPPSTTDTPSTRITTVYGQSVD